MQESIWNDTSTNMKVLLPQGAKFLLLLLFLPLPPPSSPPHSSFILTSSLWKHELSEVGGQLQEGIKGVRGADWENKLITETPPHPPAPPTPLHPPRHPEPIWSTFQSRPLKCCQPLSPGRKLPPREVPCLHLGKSQSVEGGYLCMCVCVWGGEGPPMSFVQQDGRRSIAPPQ